MSISHWELGSELLSFPPAVAVGQKRTDRGSRRYLNILVLLERLGQVGGAEVSSGTALPAAVLLEGIRSGQ